MNELIEFCLDTENPEKNYKLAQWYEKQNHTASAHVYYFRTAERTENKNFAYTSLLRSSICYKNQGKRDATEKLLIHAALSFLSERPEAYYFLSLFYQRKEEWDQCYLYADFGLKCYENEVESIDLPEYQGKYALIYQKALASWWWGKGDESKKLFQLLKDEYWDVMNDEYRNLVDEKMNAFFGISSEIPKSENQFDLKKFDWGNTDNEYIELFTKENFIEHTYEKHFSVEKDDIVLDVGSNCGSFTCSILNNKPKHVYCLEPSLNLVNALKNNISNRNNITIIPKAISDTNSEILSRDNIFIYCDEQEVYQTITFNKLIEEHNISKIDFLKTDCEGGEYFIFTPENANFIKNNVKKIAGEFHIYSFWEDAIERFKTFRDHYLKDIRYSGNFHVYERCGKDVTEKIFDDSYLIEFKNWWMDVNPYFCQFLVYVDYGKINEQKKYITENLQVDNSILQVHKLDKGNNSQECFKFLTNPKHTTWIVDNFYDNPDEIRKFALEQEFGDESVITGFVGRRTFNQFLFPGLKEAFESVMGKKITKWEEHGMNGRFQICWSGERLVYHCDEQMWGGMIYLSPNAPYQCGTTLYADKKNRARTYYDPGWDEYWGNTPGDCHLDRTPFEPVDVLGNVYNRLVIFDASCIHSASEYFGTNKENARLWQMFFFDTEK